MPAEANLWTGTVFGGQLPATFWVAGHSYLSMIMNSEGLPSEMAQILNGSVWGPGIPGDPTGIPGNTMPSILIFPFNMPSIASTGMWPATK